MREAFLSVYRCIVVLTLIFGGFSALAGDLGNNFGSDLEKKQACLKEGGNWRQFGNGCVDGCRAKFDIFALCTQALRFGCDCGEGQCWHEGKCVVNAAYKKVFDKEVAQRRKKIEELDKKRREKIKQDPAYSYYLHNLYPRPVEQSEDGKKKSSSSRSGSPPASGNLSAQVGPGAHVVRGGGLNSRPQVAQPVVRIPEAYLKKHDVLAAPPVNSKGEEQDLVFPVVDMP